MNNKIDILRAICFTEEDMENITNLGDSFTSKEIEFMVEFKKIYELGLTQLYKFIDMVDEEGGELDTSSILYYVSVLFNGPLGTYAKEYSKGKKFFSNTPDIMGMLGNRNRTSQNITIFSDGQYPTGSSTDLYNRLPSFMQQTVTSASKQTSDVFRPNLKSSSEIDNTLPISDKNPQLRYDEEGLGKFVLRSNGSYMVTDSYYYESVDDVSQEVFESVKDYLGDDVFRIYRDKKEYNSFSDDNEKQGINNKIDKKFIDGDAERVITLDLMGDEFDSEESRESVIRIESVEGVDEILLHTNEGQLGN